MSIGGWRSYNHGHGNGGLDVSLIGERLSAGQQMTQINQKDFLYRNLIGMSLVIFDEFVQEDPKPLPFA